MSCQASLEINTSWNQCGDWIKRVKLEGLEDQLDMIISGKMVVNFNLCVSTASSWLCRLQPY